MEQKATAIIDIGSNSIRYLGKNPEKQLATTRLAEGLITTGMLSEAAMERSIAAIACFVQKAHAEGLTPYAYATSAVRDAHNRTEFLARVKRACGICIDVLSGEREAQYARLVCEILYENDIKINENAVSVQAEYGAIEHAVKTGDMEKLKMLLSGFFKTLEKAMPTPAVAKTYCLELYVCIIRCCSVEKIEKYMKGIVSVQAAKKLSDIKSFIEQNGFEIAKANAPESNKIYSSLIRDTINIIDENIENENLSLRWLAGTILYTNVDYLGKLFKKETGKNFSHYVMEKRMEMAKDLIIEGKKDRIYEVAEKVGYGSNSQYFSQVFKKYTGVTPLEYREFARLAREKNEAG